MYLSRRITTRWVIEAHALFVDVALLPPHHPAAPAAVHHHRASPLWVVAIRDAAMPLRVVAYWSSVNVREEPARCDEFLRGSYLGDLPVLQHGDDSRVLNRRQAVGDDEGRPAASRPGPSPPGCATPFRRPRWRLSRQAPVSADRARACARWRGVGAARRRARRPARR